SADGLGGGARVDRRRGPRTLLDPVSLAASALPGDRLAVPRRLRPRRLSDARRDRRRRRVDRPPVSAVRDGAAAGDAAVGEARWRGEGLPRGRGVARIRFPRLRRALRMEALDPGGAPALPGLRALPAGPAGTHGVRPMTTATANRRTLWILVGIGLLLFA